MTLFDIILSSFVLILLVSVDIFVVGFSYGTSRIRVSWKTITLISFIGNLILAAALLLGYFVGFYFSEDAISWTVFSLFMLAGLLKLADWMSSRKTEKKTQSISIRDAIVLAVILSIDGLAIGFASGIGTTTLIFIVVITTLSFIGDILIFKAGHSLGATLERKARRDLGWLNGVAFMMIAVISLFL
ncbi:MAG: manganese efflux pump [Firmicutes bacterium]|nr:manganese efflux pump [Bacillota bacterium]